MTQQQDIVSRLPYLESLDDTRNRIRTMLKKGLKAIISTDLTENFETWVEPLSALEGVFFRRAKHLAWHLGYLTDCDAPDILKGEKDPRLQYPPWPIVHLVPGHEKLAEEVPRNQTPTYLMHPEELDVSVFFAAAFLRARLGNLHGALDSSTVLCYYRVVREVYNLLHADWAIGGARCGSGTIEPNNFITSECARALSFLSRLARNTRRFLDCVRNIVIEYDSLSQLEEKGLHPRPPQRWIKEKKRHYHALLQNIVEENRDYILLTLPEIRTKKGREKSWDTLLKQILRLTRHFTNQSRKSLATCEKMIVRSEARELEIHISRVDTQGEEDNEDRKARIEALIKTSSCVALQDVRLAILRFTKISKEIAPRKQKGILQNFGLLSEFFGWLDGDTRKHLRPIRRFSEGELCRSIYAVVKEGNLTSVQDLAFSAVSYGVSDGDWNSSMVLRAAEILQKHISIRGEFPGGRPFYTTSNGGEGHIHNAHVIRAFCQIMQHCRQELDPVAIKRFRQYFARKSKKVRTQNGAPIGIGWQRPGQSLQRQCSLWVSSISCIALQRMQMLLSTRINHEVAQHLSRSNNSGSTSDRLSSLMWPDLGIAITARPLGVSPVFDCLNQLRVQLMSPRARQALGTSTSSVVFYGPPGTGKTTLIQELGRSCGADVYAISPADFVVRGEENLEQQASAVMKAVGMLSHAVILFDEFDTILQSRDNQKDSTRSSILEFLTGNMLPKLADLNDRAEENSFVYALATNYVENLDTAAIRTGRFDLKCGVYFPDAISRAFWLARHAKDAISDLAKRKNKSYKPEGIQARIAEVVIRTSFVSLADLFRGGLFAPPRVDDPGASLSKLRANSNPIWRYVLWGKAMPNDAIPLPGLTDKVKGLRRDISKKADVDLQATRIMIATLVHKWEQGFRALPKGKKVKWSTLINTLETKKLRKEIRSEREILIEKAIEERLGRKK